MLWIYAGSDITTVTNHISLRKWCAENVVYQSVCAPLFSSSTTHTNRYITFCVGAEMRNQTTVVTSCIIKQPVYYLFVGHSGFSLHRNPPAQELGGGALVCRAPPRPASTGRTIVAGQPQVGGVEPPVPRRVPPAQRITTPARRGRSDRGGFWRPSPPWAWARPWRRG